MFIRDSGGAFSSFVKCWHVLTRRTSPGGICMGVLSDVALTMNEKFLKFWRRGDQEGSDSALMLLKIREV